MLFTWRPGTIIVSIRPQTLLLHPEDIIQEVKLLDLADIYHKNSDLFSVNPKLAAFMQDLFVLNERATPLRLATGAAREPRENELRVLEQALARYQTHFQHNHEEANKLLRNGESPRHGQLDAATHAAFTVVAQTLLNLDETITSP